MVSFRGAKWISSVRSILRASHSLHAHVAPQGLLRKPRRNILSRRLTPPQGSLWPTATVTGFIHVAVAQKLVPKWNPGKETWTKTCVTPPV